MRRSIAAALAALVVLGCADTAAAAERCKVPRGSQTVAKSSYTWVYRQPARTEPENPSYACNRRTGRRFLLDDTSNETHLEGPGFFNGGAPPQLAGTHLAYALTTYEGADGEYTSLRALDLKTGKKRRLGAWADSADEFLYDFQLVKSGVVAWSALGAEGQEGEIGLWGRDGKAELDRGATVDPGSFAVSADRTRVYWTNGDQPKSAPIR